MSLVTRVYTFTDGTTAYGSQVDTEIANLVNTFNNLDQGNTTWTNVKVTTLSPQGNIAMGGHKLTGLTSGSTTGDSVAYEQIVGTLVPTGSITMFGAATAPTGYLLCDGSAVSRSTYANLFGVISTTYGVGDGSTTFNVPSMANKVPIGGGSTAALGASAGATTTSHSHTAAQSFSFVSTVTPTGTIYNIYGDGGGGSLVAASSTSAGGSSRQKLDSISVDSGASTTLSTIQPCVGVTFIIKT